MGKGAETIKHFRRNMRIHERDAIPAPDVQTEADLTFPGLHPVELRNIRAAGAL